MTFEYIKKRIAHDIGYMDPSDEILTGKDITETDIGYYVNERYVNDLFQALSTQYPEDYEIISTAPFYKSAGTVSATSTGQTLVTNESIFDTGMVGDRVYNSTDATSAVITAYVGATSVTLDTTIDDDWDGDSIYILGHEFALGGEATDSKSIRRVEVKYRASDSFYRVAIQRDQNDLYQYGNEIFWENKPQWYNTTLKVNGIQTSAIGIVPEPKNGEGTIKIRYIEYPTAMSATTDVPRLPLDFQNLLVIGGTIDALRAIRQDAKAERMEMDYQAKKQVAIANYALTRTGTLPRVRTSRRYLQRFNRAI